MYIYICIYIYMHIYIYINGCGSKLNRRGYTGLGYIWVWLKIKQEGQTTGFHVHVSTYQGKPFWDSGVLDIVMGFSKSKSVSPQ